MSFGWTSGWEKKGGCRCIGGAEVQQNLLVRLQNLSQLEALLTHAIALLPTPPSLHLIAGPHAAAQPQKKSQVDTTSKVMGDTCALSVPEAEMLERILSTLTHGLNR